MQQMNNLKSILKTTTKTLVSFVLTLFMVISFVTPTPVSYAATGINSVKVKKVSGDNITVNISWNAVANASKYQVYWKDTKHNRSAQNIVGGTSWSTNIQDGRTIYVTVEAYTSGYKRLAKYEKTATFSKSPKKGNTAKLSAATMTWHGHVSETEANYKQAPTCSQPGNNPHIYYACCDKYTDMSGKTITKAQAIPPATGKHKWSAWKTRQEATYTKEGKQERQCTECGKIEEKSIPKLTPPESGSDASEKDITYNITWKNWDGTVLTSTEVKKGDMPTYPGSTPVKPDTENGKYTFKGWSPNLTVATANTVYVAQFKAEAIESPKDPTEPVIEDPTKPTTEDPSKPTVEDPTEPVIEDPTKPTTEDPSKPTIEDPTEPSTPAEEQNTRCYITWKNWDGKILATSIVKKGEMPSYTGPTPTKSDEEHKYVHDGWTPTVTIAEKDTIYTAVFKEETTDKEITVPNSSGDNSNNKTAVTENNVTKDKNDSTSVTNSNSKKSTDKNTSSNKDTQGTASSKTSKGPKTGDTDIIFLWSALFITTIMAAIYKARKK